MDAGLLSPLLLCNYRVFCCCNNDSGEGVKLENECRRGSGILGVYANGAAGRGEAGRKRRGRKGREPPFIHHMVQPRVDSRHFRNLTTTPKLAANHNSSTWCRFGDYILRWDSLLKSPPQFGGRPPQQCVKGKSAQVSEDGGFLRGSVLLRACYWRENLLLASFFLQEARANYAKVKLLGVGSSTGATLWR